MDALPRSPFRAALLGALTLTVVACGEAPQPVAPAALPIAPSPLIVPTPLTVKQVSAGYYNSCAILTDDTVRCWGSNSDGVSTPPAGQFVQVSMGYLHGCGIRTDETLACWGSDDRGVVSNPPAGTFTQVASSYWLSCAIATSGSVACWGRDDYGHASQAPSGAFTQVAVTEHTACALRADATLTCWGTDFDGTIANVPAGTFSRVSGGQAHFCAVATDQSLACWGWNFGGQLNAPSGTYTGVAPGGLTTCAVATDASVSCWGLGSATLLKPPAGPFTYIEAGVLHVCGIRPDSTVTCWGNNGDGESTPPSGSTRVHPVASIIATPVVVAPGATFTVSLTNAQVPGYPQATSFTYAFDCGDGAGFGAATPNASAPCVAGAVGAQTVQGKLFDQEGDSAVFMTSVRVTQTSQAITFTSQPPTPALVRGSYAVSATGGGSGNPVVFSSLTPGVCTVNGATVSLNNVGACTITANQAGSTAYSAAPQVTQSFAIVYGFVGFSQPVDNLPTVNTANSGQAIPLKWRAVDATGAPVTTLTTVTVTVTSLPCSIGSTPDQLEEYATGASGLQNLGNGYYQFNWKTPKTYAKSCKTMHLDMGDGLARDAVFNFTK